MVRGSSKQVLHRFSEVLPNKHGRGGQSANRFARLREECRRNYVKKVAEAAATVFAPLNLAGLILAGSADLKSVLGREGGLLDAKLRAKVVKQVDVAYGGMAGFNQAIDLASDCLGNLALNREKEAVGAFFDAIAKKGGEDKVCYGARDVKFALESGAVSKLLCWTGLRLKRSVEDGEEKWVEDESNGELLLDWLIRSRGHLGVDNLELVSERTEVGSQFVGGFGGLAATLR